MPELPAWFRPSGPLAAVPAAALLLSCLLAAGATGCNGTDAMLGPVSGPAGPAGPDDRDPGDPGDPGQVEVPELELQLVLRDSEGRVTDAFQRGEPVTYVFTIVNHTGETQSVRLLTGQRSDYLAADRTGQLEWAWSHDKFFQQIAWDWEIEAGDSVLFVTDWDQRDVTGEQVAPGLYEAWALIPTSPTLRTARLPLRIE